MTAKSPIGTRRKIVTVCHNFSGAAGSAPGSCAIDAHDVRM
jgi:hypothetical protein